MKIYVVEGVLDNQVQIGFALSKSVAEAEAKKINEYGGIGYAGNKVYVTEYECTPDSYTEFDAY